MTDQPKTAAGWRGLAIVALVVLPLTAHAEDRSWHLQQNRFDGAIASVLRNLTKAECDHMADEINRRHECIIPPSANGCTSTLAFGPTDVKNAECWQ